MNTFPKITSFDKNNVTHPEAQFPLADPPLEVHSLDVKQVPFWLELKTRITFCIHGQSSSKTTLCFYIITFKYKPMSDESLVVSLAIRQRSKDPSHLTPGNGHPEYFHPFYYVTHINSG